MKHQHSSQVAKPPVHAAPKVRAKPARASKAISPRTDEPADSRDGAIRETAYAFYETRGGVDGHELDDWFEAETEAGRAAVADPVESIDERQPEP